MRRRRSSATYPAIVRCRAFDDPITSSHRRVMRRGAFMSQTDTKTVAAAGATEAAEGASDRISRRRVLAVYKQMLVSLFIATLVVIAILTAFLLVFFISYYVKGNANTHDPPLMLIVLLAGSLGAFFSALLRLYNFQDLPKAMVARELEGLPKGHLIIYSLVPAVVGAISATVLYMLFASGLVQGDLFPSFVCKKGEAACKTFGMLIGEWGPDEATDYAKAIVWGFIAGFAERLVPDTLQSLSKSAQQKGTQGGAADAEEPR